MPLGLFESEKIHVIDVEGEQVADLMFFARSNTEEYLYEHDN